MSHPFNENTISPQSSDIDDSPATNSAFISELGAKANGIEIAIIRNTANIPGVPDEMPVALIRGEHPRLAPVTDVLDAYRLRPKRKLGIAKTTSLASFIELTIHHKTEHSVIFADIEDLTHPKLVSVINYHHASKKDDLADYLDHRIEYDFPLSEEWKAWSLWSGSNMDQADLAEFIEKQITDLADPCDDDINFAKTYFSTTVATPAQMIELARGLQVNINCTVKNAITLQTGESTITYNEEHKGQDGKPVNVPGMFVLQLEPFKSGASVRILAQLRYRVKDGAVKWLYKLYRADSVITGAINDSIKSVVDSTGLPAFEGRPE